MGTRLRARMLWGAVLVSLIPIASMYAFSYLLLNRAVDRWFSQPVTEMRDDSNNMALELARYTTANARAEADSIAAGLPEASAAVSAGPVEAHPVTPATAVGHARRRASHTPPHTAARPAALSAARVRREAVSQVLRQHEITLQNGFAIVYHDGLADCFVPDAAAGRCYGTGKAVASGSGGGCGFRMRQRRRLDGSDGRGDSGDGSA